MTLNTGSSPTKKTHLPCRRFCRWGAGEILFKSEGLSGYSKRASARGKELPATLQTALERTGTICLNDQGGNDGCDNRYHLHPKSEIKSSTLHHGLCVFDNHGKDTRFTGPIDVAPTISATYGTGGNNQPFVVENSKTYDVRFTSEGTVNARSNVYESDTARTIDTSGNAPTAIKVVLQWWNLMVYKVL